MKTYELALNTVRDIAVINRIIDRHDRDLSPTQALLDEHAAQHQ